MISGSRSIFAAPQAGQLSGSPVRSLLTSARTWAGLYVFGRGLRMLSCEMSNNCSTWLAVRLGRATSAPTYRQLWNERTGGYLNSSALGRAGGPPPVLYRWWNGRFRRGWRWEGIRDRSCPTGTGWYERERRIVIRVRSRRMGTVRMNANNGPESTFDYALRGQARIYPRPTDATIISWMQSRPPRGHPNGVRESNCRMAATLRSADVFARNHVSTTPHIAHRWWRW